MADKMIVRAGEDDRGGGDHYRAVPRPSIADLSSARPGLSIPCLPQSAALKSSFSSSSMFFYLYNPFDVLVQMIDPPVLNTNFSHWLTRPKPAYWQGLHWIVGPEYSFRVFSTSRFAPSAQQSFFVTDTCSSFTGVPTDLTDMPFKEVIIFLCQTPFCHSQGVQTDV